MDSSKISWRKKIIKTSIPLLSALFAVALSILIVPPSAFSEEGTCYLEAVTDVYVEVYDLDRQGNDGEMIWSGRLNDGETVLIKAPPVKKLNLRFSELENALNHALESAQSLGMSAEDNIDKLSAEELVDIPTELSRNIAKRIRDAAEMGDVTSLNAIAEEIKDQSDSCLPLGKQITQMAEDFDLDGIQKLADKLESI